MSYGKRYIDARGFLTYCEKLGVLGTENELETYEREGLMLPVARVVQPEEYAKALLETRLRSTDEPPMPEELIRLRDDWVFLKKDYVGVTEEDLLEPFDREFGKNCCLTKPVLGGYRPWSTFNVVATNSEGQEAHESAATHYYSYWQVHQLYDIQRFPDLYDNRFIMEALPSDFKREFHLPRAYPQESYRTFHGDANFFDFLSYYITTFEREQYKAFAGADVRHSVRKLDGQRADEYIRRLSAQAKAIMGKYCLDERECRHFLVRLVILRNKYRDSDRSRLAGVAERDSLHFASFLVRATGKEYEQIAAEATQNCAWSLRRDVRHVDRPTKTREDARQVLVDASAALVRAFRSGKVCGENPSEDVADIEGLLTFCEKTGPYFLLHALEVLYTPAAEKRPLNRVDQFTALMNLAVSFEYLLRSLWPRQCRSVPTGMDELVERSMSNEPWLDKFRTEYKQLKRGEGALIAALEERNLETRGERTVSAESHVAESFAISCAARNLVVHSYIKEDWIFGDLFWEAAKAITTSILLSWAHATKAGWVKSANAPD